MTKLTTTDLKWLEERFMAYGDYEKEIVRRRFELNYKPENQTPETQRHPSQQSQVENFVVKVMTDDYINDRERWIEGIGKVFDEVDSELEQLARYKFIEYPYLSWEEVGIKLNYSRSKVYRMRYAILHKFAKEIKYI